MPTLGVDLFSVALDSMRHAAARQQVLSENIANADTPGALAKDLAPFDFDAALQDAQAARGQQPRDPGRLNLTSAKHIASADDDTAAEPRAAKSWETLPGGNAISLEQQMLQMNETKLVHDQAAAYYHKAADLLRAAMSSRF